MQLGDELVSKMRFLESTVCDGQDGPPATSAFYMFADGVGGLPVRAKEEAQGGVTRLPFTLAEAASYLRHPPRRPLPTTLGASSFFLGTGAGTSLGDGSATRASMDTFYSAFLQQRSADVLAVDFVSAVSPECPPMDEHTKQEVVDALALGAHLLKPTGALLLRLPLSLRWHDTPARRVVMRHMRLFFQLSACEVEGEYVYCVGCRGTREAPITSELKTPFFGGLKTSAGLSSRWNPRKKRRNLGRFAAQMPAFATVPLAKQSLGRDAAEGVDAAGRAEDRAEDFFGLSVGMVERGAFYSKRDD